MMISCHPLDGVTLREGQRLSNALRGQRL